MDSLLRTSEIYGSKVDNFSFTRINSDFIVIVTTLILAATIAVAGILIKGKSIEDSEQHLRHAKSLENDISSKDKKISDLESELRATKESLKTSNEDLSSVKKELTSVKSDLDTVSSELNSARLKNKDLETSLSNLKEKNIELKNESSSKTMEIGNLRGLISIKDLELQALTTTSNSQKGMIDKLVANLEKSESTLEDERYNRSIARFLNIAVDSLSFQ